VTRNLVRAAILLWLGISLYSGLSAWSDHEVPVVVQVPVTEQNLSGFETKYATYECPAPIGGSGSAELQDDLTNIVGPSRTPCGTYLRGRQVLFWVDIAAGAAALALTFAHLPRRLWSRRTPVQTVTA
jgi:hypothetical protein